MIYRFLILSDEVDNFSREITIDSEATFLDLQNVILDSVNYTKDQITSFFICDEDWGKKDGDLLDRNGYQFGCRFLGYGPDPTQRAVG